MTIHSKEKTSQENESIIQDKTLESYVDVTNKNIADPEDFFNWIDKLFQANLAKITNGISPAALATSFFSWGAQMSLSPGRMLELMTYPMVHGSDCCTRMLSELKPANGEDVRFQSDNWQELPWRLYAESFLHMEDWWRCATTGVYGMPVHSERTVSFVIRQLLDAICPANFVLTNPDLFKESIRSGGANIVRGLEIGVEDILEKITSAPRDGLEHFIPGKQVAVTPGKVVFKNHLIELIQYEAQTKHVYKEPILIIPAWIMKYYILDLSPENSMVKWLVSQGHTVFIISWLNPQTKDRNLDLDDYYRLGAMAAIHVISEKMPNVKIHLMGYCLGGTLAMITVAAMKRLQDERVKTVTLLAAQGDFTEAGELMLFITESEIAFLENMMWEKGYLDTKQMAGSFQMLRSYDLIWSKMVQDYMHGKKRGMIDLLAWNADATRMPYKMHSEYLDKLFLNNDFAAGRFTVEGHLVVPSNIHVPAFIVSTEKDHVAPWPSVYKLHLMLKSDITFVLANGGHNAGIVSEPGHSGRFYRIHEHKINTAYLGPEQWYKVASLHDGSWWLAWQQWLNAHSTTKKIAPPKLDASLPDAPGVYVLEK